MNKYEYAGSNFYYTKDDNAFANSDNSMYILKIMHEFSNCILKHISVYHSKRHEFHVHIKVGFK
jgi:hypothetical protein